MEIYSEMIHVFQRDKRIVLALIILKSEKMKEILHLLEEQVVRTT